MSTISFYYFLKPGRSTVYCRIRYNKKLLTEISTKVTGGVLPAGRTSEAKRIKVELIKFESRIEDIFKNLCRLTGNPSPEALREALSNHHQQDTIVSDLTLSGMVKHYSETISTRLNKSTGLPLSDASITQWKVCCSSILCLIDKVGDFDFSRLISYPDDSRARLGDYADKIRSYFSSKFAPLTCQEYTNKLISIVKHYADKYRFDPSYFTERVIIRNAPQNDVVVLSKEQIDFIINNFDNIRSEARTILQKYVVEYAYAGLFLLARSGDMKSLTRHNLIKKGDWWISYKPNKTKNSTGVRIYVPIPDKLAEMFLSNADKYDGHLLPPIMEEHDFICKPLRAVFKKYPIFQQHVKIFRRGKEESGPFWKFMKMHMMRGSGATNQLMMGVPEQVVKNIGGWTHNSDSFGRYLKIMDEAKAEHIGEYYRKMNV